VQSVVRTFDLLCSQNFVAAQGALVGSYAGDGRLHIAERHPAALQDARDLVRRAAATGLTVHWFAGRHWFVSAWDETVEAEARAVGADPVVRPLDTVEVAPDKLMLIAPPSGTVSLREMAGQLPAGLHASFSGERFLEITRRGVDKGWAVERYCRARRIDAAQVLAIGDGPNDLPLFCYAGMSVAPANAHPDVLAAATAVTADNDHDGIAAALDALIG
jgi:hydroxymethylpyrimidine pyrophosphatase-like HAD family hydrolase